VDLVKRVLAATAACGACIPGLELSDTIKKIDDKGTIVEHPARPAYRAVQTPQGFQYRGILSAYLSAGISASAATDDSEVWSMAGGTVMVVDGERGNVKITYPEDLP